jgi:diguanylate cyclase (GGDEF)-like protein
LRGILEMKMFGDISIYNLTGLPNFFDFIEADVNKIFDKKGVFIVLNIFNLRMINEKYGNVTGDLCIVNLTQVINNIISKYPKIYGFRFSENDFIVTLPNYCLPNINEFISEIEEDFEKSMQLNGLSDINLFKYSLEYSQNINTIEDFYEFLLKSTLKVSENEEGIDRIIQHLVWTFTRNIRSTSTLALKDDISGLSNHRAGRIFVSNLINEHSQCEKGFAVMFIDGDNLKRYNQISYEAGNKMIRNLSQIISNSIRDKDKVFRWLSGDEFLVVLKEVDEENCIKLAERVREAVESQTLNYIFPTTISIGIAHYPTDGTVIDDIINYAEKANSYAKNMGRNKVVKWENTLENKIR